MITRWVGGVLKGSNLENVIFKWSQLNFNCYTMKFHNCPQAIVCHMTRDEMKTDLVKSVADRFEFT